MSSNIYNFSRQILRVESPRNEEEVQSLVKKTLRDKVPVYPVSTGKNYGLGSHLPVQDGCVVIELSRMDRILDYDEELGILTIEAGVTQEQVCDFLEQKKSPFFLNVTGSSKKSSVLGNALDGGVAHYGKRSNEILSLRGILGNGELFSTGLRHSAGLDSTQLFIQTSFGIVTSGTYKLLSRGDAFYQVSLEAQGRDLKTFLDELMRARREGILPANLHLSNLNRRKSIAVAVKFNSGLSFDQASLEYDRENHSEYVAVSSLFGNETILRAHFEILQNRFQIKCNPGLHTCSDGTPSDEAILSLGYSQRDPIGSELLDSDSSTLFNVSLVPASGRHALKAISVIKKIYSSYGFEDFITLNLVDDTCFEMVANLTFRRSDKNQSARAHLAHLEAMRKLNDEGYVPQRLSIFQMGEFQRSDLHQMIKLTLDPLGVISPGRY